MENSIDIRAHFGLHLTPFTREFPISKRYKHPQYDEQVKALYQTVVDRMSGAIITSAGRGKTVVVRTLVDILPEARFRTHYIKVTGLSKRDMCREIARVVGCQEAGQYNTLVHRIQSHLMATSQQEGIRPVLIIDEAHELKIQVLSMLRILTNFDMDSRLVVSIILCGQTKLGQMLQRDEMEAVSRRLIHVGTLRNLSREETRHYVKHRQTMSGNRQDLFDDSARDALFEIGGGNLRATDHLALKSLHIAAEEGAKVVDSTHVVKARERLWP